MAEKRKKPGGQSGPKKKPLTAQERVKRSQESKKRRRAPKGSPHAGSFAAGAGQHKNPVASSGRYRGMTGSTKREMFQDARNQHIANGLSHADASSAARDTVRSRLMGPDGPNVSPKDMGQDTSSRLRVTSSDAAKVEKQDREANWKHAPGLYTEPGATRGQYLTPAEMVGQLSPSHKAWYESQIGDSTSELNQGLPPGKARGKYASPGAHRRGDQYLRGLQEGHAHTDALAQAKQDSRGRRPATGTSSSRRRTGLATPTKAGRKSKYESGIPSDGEFSIGISAPRVDSLTEIGRKMPGLSDRELAGVQQFQRESIGESLLKNQKWAQETRHANIIGGDAHGTGRDRVVVFTTNLGNPSVHVPADSLIGQYVIKRRKGIMRREGTPDGRLQGSFPEAVRDIHIMEASTGLSFGAEGKWGAFQKTGWRRGNTKSKNYGRPTPVGSKALIDSQGRPIYDSQGNVRMTEGSTRPFRFETMKDAGLRVFVG